MSTNFYRAFEERYYAPRSVIIELRRQYLPFVKVLSDIYPKGKAYDAGCGRGEWLELMLEEGLDPYGVDLEDGMLAACHELKLSVGKGDAVEFIASLEDESQIIVTAFHVVEHISFSALQTFINEALRVLKPGGLLIMETPNPENIKVATENFYLDPTHIKPIPSKLLSFLPEFYGYKRTEIIRLQENKELARRENISLLDVIDGTSPDYAVIAQKEAHEEILEKFDDAFSNSDNTGLPLTELAAKFENRLQEIETKAEQAETKAKQAEAKAKAEQAEAKAEQAEAKAEQAEAKAEQAEAEAEQAEAEAEQAETRAHQYHAELQSVYASRSWRLTKPLRELKRYLKLFSHWLKESTTWCIDLPKHATRRCIVKLLAYSLKHPELRARARIWLHSYPKIEAKLRRLAATGKHPHANVTNTKAQGSPTSMPAAPPKLAGLTPDARRIYGELNTAIAQQEQGNR